MRARRVDIKEQPNDHQSSTAAALFCKSFNFSFTKDFFYETEVVLALTGTAEVVNAATAAV